jgi:hypothetical protein
MMPARLQLIFMFSLFLIFVPRMMSGVGLAKTSKIGFTDQAQPCDSASTTGGPGAPIPTHGMTFRCFDNRRSPGDQWIAHAAAAAADVQATVELIILHLLPGIYRGAAAVREAVSVDVWGNLSAKRTIPIVYPRCVPVAPPTQPAELAILRHQKSALH